MTLERRRRTEEVYAAALELPAVGCRNRRGAGALDPDHPRTTSARRWLDWRWDIGRTLDYPETRGDVDSQRIGYFGVSFGATFPLHLPALESRFRVAMLVAGGTAFSPMSHSTDPAHYAPRIKIPAGHVIPRRDLLQSSLGWLDEYLGPVR